MTVSQGQLIAAEGLSVAYSGRRGQTQVLLDVSLSLEPGRILGLAGESGSGKSTLALCLMGYRQPGQRVLHGSVELAGTRITGASIGELRRLWGSRLAYLPQDTSTSLNPALTVGRHFVESLRKHEGVSRDEAVRTAEEWLGCVAIPDPAGAMRRFPHQFSGGQQQRIAAALALSLGPEVLILDEPTTGLDVVTQARVNDLVTSLARGTNVATLYVSHNLAMLATVCDDLAIMYAGQTVESGPVPDVYFAPRHPYTAALIAAVPAISADSPPRGIAGVPRLSVVEDECSFRDRCPKAAPECRTAIPMVSVGPQHLARCIRIEVPSPPDTTAPSRPDGGSSPEGREPILRAEAITCTFGSPAKGGGVRAVDNVSVEVLPGRTLGIAGESGSGKSTLLKIIAGLVTADDGTVTFEGERLHPRAARRTRGQRRGIQMIFQNPDATLNPRHTIAQSLERPLRLFGEGGSRAEMRSSVARTLEDMRIPAAVLERYPRDLSGGQRQRVAIARALLADPAVLLCDEVTSALDVSVQASILELLLELRRTRRLAMIFVTHDLGVLRAVADEVVIMQNGSVCERGTAVEVLRNPQHEYTRRLIEAIPAPRVHTAGGVGAF